MTFTGVAKTITKDIVDPFALQNGSLVILAALLAAIAWNLITWYYGIPSSSSHAIIGSIAGAAIAAAGISSLNLKGFIKIIEALIISPIIAFVIGYTVYSIFKVVFKNFNLTKRIRTSVYSRFSLQHYKPTHTVRMMHKSNGNHYDGSYG